MRHPSGIKFSRTLLFLGKGGLLPGKHIYSTSCAGPIVKLHFCKIGAWCSNMEREGRGRQMARRRYNVNRGSVSRTDCLHLPFTESQIHSRLCHSCLIHVVGLYSGVTLARSLSSIVKMDTYNYQNSEHYPLLFILHITQLNSIGLSVTLRKHITSPLRAQQANVIYRFVTMVYSYNYHNSGQYPSSCLLFKTQLNKQVRFPSLRLKIANLKKQP
jgi:hypothetical protein